jgi:indolepyruvate ferredoxin oxidoreductase
MQFPLKEMLDAIGLALNHKNLDVVDATSIATQLMGDSIATNLFVLGYAWQKGLVPVSLEALMRAIELNGAAVDMNKTAFGWGRLAAHDLKAVRHAAGLDQPKLLPIKTITQSDQLSWGDAGVADSLDDIIARRVAFLTDYQSADYAARYTHLVNEVRAAEQRKVPGSSQFTTAVAKYLYKLMAIKDEWEVARLYTSGEFEKRIAETFDGDYTVHFNLAPPLLAKRDEHGHLKKAEYGPWVFKAFKLMAKFRRFRGAWFDVFSKTDERKMERQLLADYIACIEELLGGIDRSNIQLATDIASLPEQVRGYGHVKEAHVAKVRERWSQLMQTWRKPPAVAKAA